jgi:hypothetical protein
MTRTRKTLALALLLALAPLSASAARLQPTSDLLLPWFEVDLDPSGVTTRFAVGNASEKPVEVFATVLTNWGIPILEVPFPLQPGEVRTVNLRDWLRDGGDPRKALSSLELAHVAAAASGQASPKDQMYYGSAVRTGLAVGSVTLRTRNGLRDALWGDWSMVDAGGTALRGEALVDIDRSGSHTALCRQHLLRYQGGDGFDAGTEMIVWRETAGRPSASPDAPPGLRLAAGAVVFEPGKPAEPGEPRRIELPTLDTVTVADLGLPEPAGALRLETAEDVFIGVRQGGAATLQAYCVAGVCESRRTALAVDVLLDGRAAEETPGPLVDSGSRLTWTLTITNTGELPVSGIEIEGLAASCPGSELEAGESMECTAAQTALSNPQIVPVAVTGQSSCANASARATGYYEGVLVDVYP